MGTGKELKLVKGTDEVDEHTFYVKIHGKDMSPYLNKGDIAVVVPSAELINGRLCFATWPSKDGRRLVKRYYQYGDTIVLKSDNPAFEDVEINANNGNGVKIYRVKKSIREIKDQNGIQGKI